MQSVRLRTLQGARTLAALLGQSEVTPTPERARALLAAADLALVHADGGAAALLLEEALDVCRGLADTWTVASRLRTFSGPAPARGHADRACNRDDGPRLTPRETEILALLAQGLTNKAIAARLVLSVPTIQTHLANLYAKIGVHCRSAATAHAIMNGLAFENP